MPALASSTNGPKVKTNAWRGQYAVANQRFSFPAEDLQWEGLYTTPPDGMPAVADQVLAEAS